MLTIYGLIMANLEEVEWFLVHIQLLMMVSLSSFMLINAYLFHNLLHFLMLSKMEVNKYIVMKAKLSEENGLRLTIILNKLAHRVKNKSQNKMLTLMGKISFSKNI